ncbi:hypothetical protein CAOG_07979 [Capsaspora owczarzaki ATCC 30864]|uniref:hypothetical protein n=1 Tax=Capsaspora owczarzaki (strain ATCC 30864) TaxID=595528 RepID=UPI0001FE5EDE|nr:hypothetical protein CAOG_07979 [Capsaspora owczarzaki ATCC 30864]|eukprot:XP_004342580.1 hypothetical protein CAOG_07979 [Capsaspora owczarzaki ATCC 30864]
MSLADPLPVMETPLVRGLRDAAESDSAGPQDPPRRDAMMLSSPANESGASSAVVQHPNPAVCPMSGDSIGIFAERAPTEGTGPSIAAAAAAAAAAATAMEEAANRNLAPTLESAFVFAQSTKKEEDEENLNQDVPTSPARPILQDASADSSVDSPRRSSRRASEAALRGLLARPATTTAAQPAAKPAARPVSDKVKKSQASPASTGRPRGRPKGSLKNGQRTLAAMFKQAAPGQSDAAAGQSVSVSDSSASDEEAHVVAQGEEPSSSETSDNASDEESEDSDKERKARTTRSKRKKQAEPIDVDAIPAFFLTPAQRKERQRREQLAAAELPPPPPPTEEEKEAAKQEAIRQFRASRQEVSEWDARMKQEWGRSSEASGGVTAVRSINDVLKKFQSPKPSSISSSEAHPGLGQGTFLVEVDDAAAAAAAADGANAEPAASEVSSLVVAPVNERDLVDAPWPEISHTRQLVVETDEATETSKVRIFQGQTRPLPVADQTAELLAPLASCLTPSETNSPQHTLSAASAVDLSDSSQAHQRGVWHRGRVSRDAFLADVLRRHPSFSTAELDWILSSYEQRVGSEHVAWTDKYKPACSAHLIGNQDPASFVRQWLAEWKVSQPSSGTPAALMPLLTHPLGLGPAPALGRSAFLGNATTNQSSDLVSGSEADSNDDNDGGGDDDDDDDDDDDGEASDDSDFETPRRKSSRRRSTKAKLTARSAAKPAAPASADAQQDICNTLVISGPTGTGKTSCVYACAQELHYKIFEVNAASDVSGRQLLHMLGEATQSHQVGTFIATANANSAIRNAFSTLLGSAAAAAAAPSSPAPATPSSSVQTPLPSKGKSISSFFSKPSPGASPTPAPSLKTTGKRALPANHQEDAEDGGATGKKTSPATNSKRPRLVVADDECANDGVTSGETGNGAALLVDLAAASSNSTMPAAVGSLLTPSASTLLATSSSLSSFASSNTKAAASSLILLEDTGSLLLEQDRDFWTALASLQHSSKRPIIIVTDPAHHQRVLDRLSGAYLTASFRQPSNDELTVHLRLICFAEGILTSDADIRAIVSHCKMDVRRCLVILQFWARTELAQSQSAHARILPLATGSELTNGRDMLLARFTENVLGLGLHVSPYRSTLEFLSTGLGRDLSHPRLLSAKRDFVAECASRSLDIVGRNALDLLSSRNLINVRLSTAPPPNISAATELTSTSSGFESKAAVGSDDNDLEAPLPTSAPRRPRRIIDDDSDDEEVDVVAPMEIEPAPSLVEAAGSQALTLQHAAALASIDVVADLWELQSWQDAMVVRDVADMQARSTDSDGRSAPSVADWLDMHASISVHGLHQAAHKGELVRNQCSHLLQQQMDTSEGVSEGVGPDQPPSVSCPKTDPSSPLTDSIQELTWPDATVAAMRLRVVSDSNYKRITPCVFRLCSPMYHTQRQVVSTTLMPMLRLMYQNELLRMASNSKRRFHSYFAALPLKKEDTALLQQTFLEAEDRLVNTPLARICI